MNASHHKRIANVVEKLEAWTDAEETLKGISLKDETWAEIEAELQRLTGDLVDIREELQDKYDKLSDDAASSERGDALQLQMDALDDAVFALDIEFQGDPEGNAEALAAGAEQAVDALGEL